MLPSGSRGTGVHCSRTRGHAREGRWHMERAPLVTAGMGLEKEGGSKEGYSDGGGILCALGWLSVVS